MNKAVIDDIEAQIIKERKAVDYHSYQRAGLVSFTAKKIFQFNIKKMLYNLIESTVHIAIQTIYDEININHI